MNVLSTICFNKIEASLAVLGGSEFSRSQRSHLGGVSGSSPVGRPGSLAWGGMPCSITASRCYCVQPGPELRPGGWVLPVRVFFELPPDLPTMSPSTVSQRFCFLNWKTGMGLASTPQVAEWLERVNALGPTGTCCSCHFSTRQDLAFHHLH